MKIEHSRERVFLFSIAITGPDNGSSPDVIKNGKEKKNLGVNVFALILVEFPLRLGYFGKFSRQHLCMDRTRFNLGKLPYENYFNTERISANLESIQLRRKFHPIDRTAGLFFACSISIIFSF